MRRLWLNRVKSKLSKEGKITINKLLVIALFFLSGFCALTYEIVWQRLFVQVTGATALATTTTLCLFMTGLALGAVSYPFVKTKTTTNGLLFFSICLEIYCSVLLCLYFTYFLFWLEHKTKKQDIPKTGCCTEEYDAIWLFPKCWLQPLRHEIRSQLNPFWLLIHKVLVKWF